MRLPTQTRSLTCQRAVELMTDYLDDALPAGRRRNLERHLRACPHCAEYLKQLRATVAATGHLDADALSPDMRESLITLYRKTMHREH